MVQKGILPVEAIQLPTGTILVKEQIPAQKHEKTVIYARVSSREQKSDLDRQVARIVDFAGKNQIVISGVVKEIGSGLNGHRQKLIQLLKDRTITTIIVEHKDRLMRFGFDYVEAALNATGRKIIVVDKEEMKDDLVADMIDILTSFCAGLYGKRSARNKAKRILQELNADNQNV